MAWWIELGTRWQLRKLRAGDGARDLGWLATWIGSQSARWPASVPPMGHLGRLAPCAALHGQAFTHAIGPDVLSTLTDQFEGYDEDEDENENDDEDESSHVFNPGHIRPSARCPHVAPEFRVSTRRPQ